MKPVGPFQWIMLLPVQVPLIAIIAIPSLWVLWLSLHEATHGISTRFVGIDNYIALLADRYFWRAFWNTFWVVNVVVYVEMAIAIGVAMLFAAGIPWRPVLLAIILLPYGVSEVVAVIIWKFMMDPQVGILVRPFVALGVPAFDWSVNPALGLTLSGLISIWLHLPFTFLLVYAARLTIPKDYYEAANIDGASRWQIFTNVTFPMLLPAILIAIIFRYIFALRMFSEVWLLTQGGPARLTEVLAIYLYKQSFTYNQFGQASAAGWVMVLISGLIAAIYLRAMYRNMQRGGTL
jgi:multiple sugar transport system permease protein